MSARGKARKRAVDLLFEADLRGLDVSALLEERSGTQAVAGYTENLVRGYLEHHEVIDEQLSSYSQGWSLERMPAVDRAILRLGAWEVLYNHAEVPGAVAIDEAVTLASALSTDESGSFVNGLLARLLDTRGASVGES